MLTRKLLKLIPQFHYLFKILILSQVGFQPKLEMFKIIKCLILHSKNINPNILKKSSIKETEYEEPLEDATRAVNLS